MKIQPLEFLLNCFRDPRKTEKHENQDVRVAVDLAIKNEKYEFVQVIMDIQTVMMGQLHSVPRTSPIYIELGAGVLPISAQFPNVKSTDIVNASHLDGVLDATDLKLEDESVDGLLLQNTFHHIPDPDAFFKECGRVLKPGGRVVILDPYHNFLSSRLYKHLFSTESYDKDGTWHDATGHAMIGANQALSYIVFVRDKGKFEAANPNLKIFETFCAPGGLRYLLSGGLNFRRIAPRRLFPIIRKLENSSLILKLFAIHWVVVLEKE